MNLRFEFGQPNPKGTAQKSAVNSSRVVCSREEVSCMMTVSTTKTSSRSTLAKYKDYFDMRILPAEHPATKYYRPEIKHSQSDYQLNVERLASKAKKQFVAMDAEEHEFMDLRVKKFMQVDTAENEPSKI